MSSNVILTLKNILVNGESVYTLDDLKNELGLTNDKSLVNFLLRFLKEEIEETTIDTMTYEKPVIAAIYDYLSAFVVDDKKCDMKSVISRLSTIGVYITSKSQQLRNDAKTNAQESPAHEKDFWHTLDHLNNELLELYKVSDKYKSEEGSYYLLEDMIYNIKNLHLIQEVNVRYPRLFLECNKDGISFFSNFLNYYLDAMADESAKISDIMYYDAVINVFLNSKKFVVSKEMKELVFITINKVNRNKGFDKSCRNQRLIFLGHLKKKLVKEDKYVESVGELNKKYGNHTLLSTPCLSDLSKIFQNQPKVYRDYINKDVITIDPTGALDLDDGISLEKLKNNNYLLGVYIADVSLYVPFNSCDDIEALHRGETIYAVDRIVKPMLPKDLSIDCCSLLPGNLRKTVVCFFEIEPDGNIKNHTFAKGVIKTRSDYHFSYKGVNHILNHGCDNQKLQNTIFELQNLSNLGLLKNFATEECSGQKLEAHLIVGKFMVLANYMAAMDAKEAGVPFLYRAHHMVEPSDIINSNPSLNTLINDYGHHNGSEILRNVIGGSFSKAYYSVDAIPHEGMGLDAYAHTTSPIRRYSDLVNQRLIKLFLIDNEKENKTIYQMADVLKEIADSLNVNQIITDQYSNDYAHVLRK